MDVEIFKIILNGGMFGLLAIIVVWILFYGAPMVRDALIQSRKAIENLAKAHLEALSAQEEKCRLERQEWFEKYAQEREKDRQSRHDSNNQLQAAIAQIAGIQRK
jgi:ABC-type transport system involved in cytochrome bd biosynthesis fused ATPase/permease subunit